MQERMGGENFNDKYNPWFYFGISAVTEAEGRAMGMAEQTYAVQEIIRNRTIFDPEVRLSAPISGTDEKNILDRIKNLISDSEARIILSESEQEVEEAYNEMMENAESIGIAILEDYMTAKMGSLGF